MLKLSRKLSALKTMTKTTLIASFLSQSENWRHHKVIEDYLTSAVPDKCQFQEPFPFRPVILDIPLIREKHIYFRNCCEVGIIDFD